ncbi:amino acid adenylation domain-containing protein [Sphaerisporangium viridialbum]|uniref:amino acid adenylation domain-containing protein n=1 Tax=Sphaerisporangium viridialbum TaxID=46189 RepID=UPI003C74FB3D
MLHLRFADLARSSPGAPAVQEGRRTFSRREIDVWADHIAEQLGASGVGAGMPVAVYLERSAVVAACALGVWKAGAALLAVDPQTPRARLRDMFEETPPAALLTQAGLRPRAAFYTGSVLHPDRLAAGDGPRAAVGDRPSPGGSEVRPDDLAYVIYTSGTTGRPKCVGVSHRSLLSILDAWTEVYRFGTESNVVLQVAGLGFDVAIGDLVRGLLTGARLVVCPREVLLSPAALHALMRDSGVDFANLTPSLLRPLVAHLRETGGRLDFMSCLVSGGESLTAADYAAVREVTGRRVRVFNIYGLTEATIDSTYYEVPDPPPATGGVPIGRAFAGTDLHVLDEKMRPADEGELYVGGRHLARGYLADAAMTAARFVAGPGGARLYRTGDRVARLPSGDLLHLGRTDDQVKVHGVRIQPAEIEAVLISHPRVRAAAVVPRVAAGTTELVAYLVTGGEAEAWEAEAEIRRFAAARLAPAAVPAALVFVPELPVTPGGKLDSRRLPEPETGVRRVPGRSPAEAAVARIWSEFLGVEVARTDLDFFELGGDSLLAARMAARLMEETGAHVPPGAVLRHPTVGELARLVSGAGVLPPIPADPGRTEGPLSPGQHRLWALHQVGGGLAAYNIPTVVRISGPLDRDVLRASLDLLVARHPALRTAFAATPDGPVQRVVAAPAIEFFEDGGGDGLEEFVRRPFDLADPPLLRASLTRTGSGEHLLVLVLHHLVSDGWTMRILLDDLGVIYSALAVGERPGPPGTAPTYLNFAVWYARRLRDGELDGQLDHWRERLRNVPPPPALPEPLRSLEGVGTRRLLLGGEVAEVVRWLAAEHRTTVFTVLLGAFAALLSRWSGQRDLIVGAPFGDRFVPGTEKLAGFFVNTVPLRFRLPPGMSFASLLRQTRSLVADAAANQEIPFDVVQRAVGEVPLTVWFNHLGPPDPAPAFVGLQTEILDAPPAGAIFDLNVYVTDLPDGLSVELVFNEKRCDRDQMAALLVQYRRLLLRAAADPDLPFEEHALTVRRERPVAEPKEHAPITATVAARARGRRDAVAVESEAGEVTYAQLGAWAGAVARDLREAGLGPGDVVAVRAERCAALPATLLGVLAAGAAFCLLDPAYPERRLAAQAERAGAVATVWARAEDGPRVGPSLRGTPAEPLAYVAFTSGTTGEPAPVFGGQTPVAHFLKWYADRFALSPSDRFALLSGVAHDPVLRDVFAPLYAGGVLCVPPSGALRAPRELARWLRAKAVTVAHVTPPLIRMLAAAAQAPLTALRLLVSGGDALLGADVDLARQLAPNASLVNFYGSTETPQAMSWQEISPSETFTGRVPVGCGIEGVELVVVGAGGQPAAPGELGRVTVRTPYLTHGRGRVYDTGDLGRHLPGGRVRVYGRADDQVKISGFRVEPGEVDVFATRLPYVRECVTVARPGPGGSRLVSYVAGADGSRPALDRLRADLRADLPAHALPSALVLVEELPMTPNGKIDRAALPLPSTPRRGPVTVADAGDAENVIAGIWAEVLLLDRVELDENFFDLGGSSVRMLAVQAALKDRWDVEIPLLTLYEYASVRALARHLRGSRSTAMTTRRETGRGEHQAERARRLAARRLSPSGGET